MSAPRYRSSRGAPAVAFADALRRGLAPDGGLFVPDRVPPLPDGWAGATAFGALAADLLAPWLVDAGPDAAADVRTALDFPVPLVSLSGEGYDGVHVLELFHGPTLSFKDAGARTLAALLDRLRPPGDPLTVLVATSGDTGSAVADAFAGRDGVRVVLLFPKDGVSTVQERQLVAARPGVTALRVAGDFDACQRLVKAALADPRLAALGLTSANSINVGRLLPQAAFYVWAAAELGRTGTDAPPVFVVPSGNLGNLTAGVLAHLGGLPVRRLVAAHNANGAFVAHLAGGPMRPAPTVRTFANAMDVGAPSNFERLAALLDEPARRRLLWGTSVSDADTLRASRAVFDATGYAACPHTAVGFEAVRRYRAATGDAAPTVVLATAHPAKFPDVVERATGVRPNEPAALARLVPGPVLDVPPTLDALVAAVLR